MHPNQLKYKIISTPDSVKKTSPRLLQIFYNLPIHRKQLIGLCSAKLLFVIAFMGMGAYLIITGGRAIVLNQAKSELALAELSYKSRIQQIASSFRSQSDNLAILAIAQAYKVKSSLEPQATEQVKQILAREIQALSINYAALVATDGTIIIHTYTPNTKTSQLFLAQHLASIGKSFQTPHPHQLTTSKIVKDINAQPFLIHYTATPLFHPPTQDFLGLIISGNVVNHDQLILHNNSPVTEASYSTLYTYQKDGQFALAAWQNSSVANSHQQHLIPNLPQNYLTLLNTAIEAPERIIPERFFMGNHPYTVVAKSLHNTDGETVAVLVRGTQEAFLNQLLIRGLSCQLIVLAFAFAIEMGLAIWLADIISRPLQALQKTTKLFSRGILEARAPVFAADEVGQLSTHFNQMADNICTYFVQVQFGMYEQKQLNQQLEIQIQERKQAEAKITQLHQDLQKHTLKLEKANRELLQNKEFFHHIINVIPDPIFVKDRHHRWQLLNDGFCQLVNYPRSEILGKSDYDIFPPERAKSAWEKDELVINTGSAYEDEGYFQDSQGKEHFISTKKTVFLDSLGNPCIVGVIRDLTHRKRLERRLARLNESFLQFTSNADDNIQLLVTVGEELLEAHFAVYRYWEAEQLYTLAQSPSSFLENQNLNDWEGKIWQQIMGANPSEPIVLDNLTSKSSPNPSQIGILVAMVVKCSQQLVGYLSIGYPPNLTPSPEDLQLVNLLASAIGVEQERKQAQQKLRKSQERFALAVEGVSDGIWDWDLQACQIYFSPRWKQILGYGDHELPNVFKSWIDNIHSDDLHLVLNKLNRYLEGKNSTYEVEFRARHKDGTYRWLLARGAALMDKNKQPCRLAGSHTDITKRKQAEKLLAKRDCYLTALLEIQRHLLADTIDQNLYQIIISLLGSITDASQVYVCENHTDNKGKLAMNLVAKWCVEDIDPGDEINQYCSYVHNFSYEDNFPRWQQTLAQGEFINGVVAEFPQSERELLAPQGILAVLILPIIVKGRFFGFLGFNNCREAKAWENSDISLLSSAASAISLAQERQISQAQEKLQLTAIEAATDGVAIINSSGEHIYCNQAYLSIFGYNQSAQLVGKLWQSLYDGDEAQRLQNIVFSKLGETGQWSGEANANREDSSTFAQEFSLTLLEDGRLICVCRDISDRKRDEAQLKANLSEKEVLLKEIHHRVKNNLYVISSLLNLQSSYVDDPHILNLFSDSQNRIQAMALIHEQLYQSQDLAQINFAEYIQRLVNNLFVSYSTSSTHIKPVLKLESICLNLDTAIPCGLIINELVTNSFKHAFPAGYFGEIQIEAIFKPDDCLHLTIRDNGVGMKPDFDWQNSHSLGLRLVNILSRQLDGKIECQNLNQGTKFYLTFSQLKYQERF